MKMHAREMVQAGVQVDNRHENNLVGMSSTSSDLAGSLHRRRSCLYWDQTHAISLIFWGCAKSPKSSVDPKTKAAQYASQPESSSSMAETKLAFTIKESSGLLSYITRDLAEPLTMRRSSFYWCRPLCLSSVIGEYGRPADTSLPPRTKDSLPRTSYSSSGLHFCRSMTCSVLSGFCHLYLPMILLMRSGDVETNPGPERTVSEEEFRELSKQIGPHYYKDVGVHLEIRNAELDQIIQQHLLNYSEAFMTIFTRWRDKQQPGTDIRALLADVLKRSDLGGLSGPLLAGSTVPRNLGRPVRPPDTHAHPAESQIKPLSPELVERCAKDFKFKYRSTLCKIRADPLNPTSLVGFKTLYTNLALEEEDGSGKRLLDYKDLLNLRVNGEFPKRILVQGEAGAGKTTFCAKIAWDWLEGRYFTDYDWVLIVPLREFQHRTIGHIAKSYLTRDNPATPSQLTHYIRSNQDKVLIAFDGLDELRGKVTQEDGGSTNSECLQSQSTDQMQHQSPQSSSDSTMQPSVHSSDTCESPSCSNEIELVDIIRSDQLEACPVFVTTRTWKAAEIRSDKVLTKLYSFIHVEGFSRENLSEYIHKYFPEDEAKANRLIEFIHENDVISDHFAHYPIYVAMLCLMWKERKEKDLEEIKALQTFSEIFRKMFGFLKKHYAEKEIKTAVGETLKEINRHLKPVAELALSGLLENNLIFSEDDFQKFPKSMDIACRVGLLSQEDRLTPSGDGDDEDTPHMKSTIFFPHKLFQEYMAGVHLASLYDSDIAQFNRLLDNVIRPRKEEFKYLLCFAVSKNKAVAKDVMKYLVQDVYEMQEDIGLLVDVAFDSQDQDVAALLENIVSSRKMRLSIRSLTAHTAAGYMFTGLYKHAFSLSCHLQECGPTLSRNVAEMICSSPSLFTVHLNGASFHDAFFALLSQKGENSKVQMLELSKVKCPTPASSQNLAEALCSMPNLGNLTLKGMDPSEEFCSTLNAKASTLQVVVLRLEDVKCLLPTASQNLAEALCSMPKLDWLSLDGKDLSEEFYSTLKAKGSTKKVQMLELSKVKLQTPAASDNLVEALCSMPKLVALALFNVDLSEEFCCSWKAKASSLKVKLVQFYGFKCPTLASSQNLVDALCSMPNLDHTILNGKDLSEEFCSTLKAKASALKIQKLGLFQVKCPTPASTQNLVEALCSMPNLDELELTTMDPSAEFCSTLKAKASTLKAKSIMLQDIKCPTQTTSRNLAEALCSVPNLTDLTLMSEGRFMAGLDLNEEFYITLNAMASSMQVQSICLAGIQCSTPTAAQNLAETLCSMPNLTRLTLVSEREMSTVGRLDLHKKFYLTLNAMASSMQVQKLGLFEVKCPTPALSQNLAQTLCSMPHLNDLTMRGMDLSGEFCSTLKAKASASKVQSLCLGGIRCSTSAKSRNLAEALCSMPNLTDLKLQDEYGYAADLHDDFFYALIIMVSAVQGSLPHLSREDFKFNGNLQENFDSFIQSLGEFRGRNPPRTSQP